MFEREIIRDRTMTGLAAVLAGSTASPAIANYDARPAAVQTVAEQQQTARRNVTRPERRPRSHRDTAASLHTSVCVPEWSGDRPAPRAHEVSERDRVKADAVEAFNTADGSPVRSVKKRANSRSVADDR